MSDIKNFLNKMGTDAGTRENYLQDPHGTMDAHGLDAEAKAAVSSGDVERVKELAGGDEEFYILVLAHKS